MHLWGACSAYGHWTTRGSIISGGDGVADQPVVAVVIVVEQERTDAEQDWIKVVDPRTSACRRQTPPVP